MATFYYLNFSKVVLIMYNINLYSLCCILIKEVFNMRIEKKMGNKGNASKLKGILTEKNIPQDIIDETLKILEKNYTELRKDINGRYYSGCCI